MVYSGCIEHSPLMREQPTSNNIGGKARGATQQTGVGSLQEAHMEHIDSNPPVKGLSGSKIIQSKMCTKGAAELENSGINLFNCTEGGMYIDGFTHCTLDSFFKNECSKVVDKKIELEAKNVVLKGNLEKML